jgi:hypothetical protein
MTIRRKVITLYRNNSFQPPYLRGIVVIAEWALSSPWFGV